METRYLLLRNNKQSGPYSIDELIGQQLKPTDLVWTEGKSRAWLHPYEMEEFTPTFTKATVTKPSTKKKEITDQNTSTERVNFDTPQYSTSVASSSANVSYSNSEKKVHEPIEEEPIRFVFHKKKAPVNYGHVAGTMIALTLLFMGWQRGWFPMHHTGSSESVVVPLISSESHTAKTRHTVHSTPIIKQEVQQPTVLTDAPVETASAPIENTTTELTPAVSRTTTPVVKERKTTKKISKPIIAPPVIKQEAITPDLIPAKTDEAAIKTEIVPITTTTIEAKPETEKKKGFGLFRGLFKKKHKDELAN